MNIYALVILFTFTAEFLLSALSNYLNLSTLRDPIPKEFEGVYTDDAYRKAQSYTRARTRFTFVVSAIDLLALLGFWLSGGFNWLDLIVRSLGCSTPWDGMLFIGALVVLKSLLSLPVSIYSTFVIEERFGFNKTTPRTFVLDRLKGLALGIVLGGPLLAAVLLFFQFAGSLAWMYCWLIVTLVTLVVQFIAPTWIMPLFNKFTPLEDGELRNSILALAREIKFPLDGVFVMDGSKRSSKSNAFFTGFGRHKRIALFDTLIAKHTVAELVAVLAHEIGHYKKKHIVKNLVISIVHTGLLFWLLSFFIGERGLFEAFGMQEVSVYAGLLFFGMLYSPLEFLISLGLHALSRRHEFEADRFAAEATHEPSAMISALKKLSVDNLSHLTPHRLYVWLNYSHPTVVDRIEALSAIRQ